MLLNVFQLVANLMPDGVYYLFLIAFEFVVVFAATRVIVAIVHLVGYLRGVLGFV